MPPDDQEDEQEGQYVEHFEKNVPEGPGHLVADVLKETASVEYHCHEKNDQKVLRGKESTR